MAKKTKSNTVQHAEADSAADTLFSSAKKLDPAIASLFATNTATQSTKKRHKKSNAKASVLDIAKTQNGEATDSEENESSSESASDGDDSSVASEYKEPSSISSGEAGEFILTKTKGGTAPLHSVDEPSQGAIEESQAKPRRKRKREDEDLESNYMQRLAQEEARDEAKRREARQAKRQKAEETTSSSAEEVTGAEGDQDSEMEAADTDEDEDEASEVPQHESQATSQPSDIEKANRTVFLGNVSSDAVTSKKAKKTLFKHMSTILENLPKEQMTHRIESFRFRSTAYTNMLPKKASYVTQDLMDSTTKSTNAYVVYTTKAAAREALKLNGTIVLGRHVRVDSVAHPAKTEPRKCVFVGNLGFVDDESAIQAAEDEDGKKKRKSRKKEPSDIEEGLWREFCKCGTVENVRVVRDSKTRVGKGFAYVQFTDELTVEAALLHDGKRFPPMLPRKLRVMRAKGIKRNASKQDTWSRPATNGVYNPKINAQQKSAIGRASKLLGRAGAALIDRPDKPARDSGKTDGLKAPESFVFEGHRATKHSHIGNKKRVSKKKGKPDNRSARRATAWKYGGEKK